MTDAGQRLRCPFCGKEETERALVEGKLLVIFPCMFSPLTDPGMSDSEIQAHLDAEYGNDPGYFRRQCDRLHLAVVKAPA